MISIKNLFKTAGALNIEGGFPVKYLNNNSLWVNLVLVLDRPLIDNIIFDEILKNNKYPLLENSIEELNEHKFMASYLMVIGYYIENGRLLLNKTKDEDLNITIHVHQDKSCWLLIHMLRKYLKKMYEYFGFDMNKINIDYRTDDPYFISKSHNYCKTNILISLSQCAGLDPKLCSGELIIPNEFIPFNIDKNEVYCNQKYVVNNDLITRIDDILISKYNDYCVNYINKNYISFNPNKNYNAKKLSKEDFKTTTILQVDKIWNPKDYEFVKIIK